MKELEKRGLLDDIAKLARLQYLSDVRLERYRTAVLNALQQIAFEEYSCAEWVEAAEYITGKHPVNGTGIK